MAVEVRQVSRIGEAAADEQVVAGAGGGQVVSRSCTYTRCLAQASNVQRLR